MLEWTGSFYDEKYAGVEMQSMDKQYNNGPRVLRGGSWDLEPLWLRSAARTMSAPRFWHGNWGFRLARTLIL